MDVHTISYSLLDETDYNFKNSLRQAIILFLLCTIEILMYSDIKKSIILLKLSVLVFYI